MRNNETLSWVARSKLTALRAAELKYREQLTADVPVVWLWKVDILERTGTVFAACANISPCEFSSASMILPKASSAKS